MCHLIFKMYSAFTFLPPAELQSLLFRYAGQECHMIVPTFDQLLSRNWLDMETHVDRIEDSDLIQIENCIGELPDLSRFSKMRILRISGCIFLKPIAHPFPPNIRHLFVGNTNLRDLPEPLPFHLDRLCAEHTHLTNLPEFPRRLTTLSLSHNWNLTKLPELPPLLNQLHIPHNAIRTIPALPPDLFSLIYHVDS